MIRIEKKKYLISTRASQLVPMLACRCVIEQKVGSVDGTTEWTEVILICLYDKLSVILASEKAICIVMSLHKL